MTIPTLGDLQTSVQDRAAFEALDDYLKVGAAFLNFIQESPPTRIVSPSQTNYLFYQYDQAYGHRITRPLNHHLFIESPDDFKRAFERFVTFLADLKKHGAGAAERKNQKRYVASGDVNKVVYTAQQAIGSIGDSFENPNQSRKRIGQLFETFVKLIIQEVGLTCEPRTINIPIPDHAGLDAFKPIRIKP